MARAYVSSVIKAPADKVWARVRNFNGLPSWHPRFRESRIENAEPADKVGCIREIHLQNGERIREQLLGLSDYDLFCSYGILESPMAITDYVATLRVMPVTDGDRTYIEWTADFGCEPNAEPDLVARLEQSVFQPGFDALKRHFGG
ncbi:SRPBCC family protein [Agrobacterium sp. NPDC058088]|uniref:SRPBCC family protein n=1 Tax=Agrobacterium sp. NPDC058088 TaxID=3346335 RepID=UPI0036DC392E